MSDTPIEVLSQPRIDTLVTDAATGAQRRRTEYTGTVWFGGRPKVTGYGTVSRTQATVIERPFFLPDSLPYRPDPLEDALVVCSVALQGSEDESHQILDYRASLVADPRNAAVSWIQLQVMARAHTPLAVSYRVTAVVALNALLEKGSGS
jgi:hypothetical protein